MRLGLTISVGIAAIVAGCESRAGQQPTIDASPSNITAADYIGPEACGDCHPDQLALWSRSLHRKMNQRATDDAVIGDFADRAVGEARFSRDAAGAYVMTLGTTPYRVTRTIGSRGLQEYVGVAADDPTQEEVRLPFGWWPRKHAWVSQPNFDPWLDEATFDPYARPTDPWATRCPWCHSTYPFVQRIARGQIRAVGHGLEQFFTSTKRAVGSERLAVEDQVTTGISCESCHLGGRAHAAGAPIHLVPMGDVVGKPGAPVATTFARERRDPDVVNGTCAQCHSGPSPRLPDGSALRNSSEALDLAGSPCRGIRCVDCHDPHRAEARGDDAHAIAACTKCHPTLARDHGQHPAAVTCLDCHMPRYVLGIDTFVRSHRISTPMQVIADAPNACSLCHLDRTPAWTLAALHQPTSADDSTTMGQRWLASPSPAIRLIAIAAYGRSTIPGARALIAPFLHDPAAYVRAFTGFALDDLARKP
ncbi:MAG: ammonia-forming cytochrome c nitrite reductase subunit c552 [Proteobacteria bacterium]|nr:ammonia-forming cytochrome c nitrite reductase subunit c552 [Pseudomonadota bacterium]